MCPAREISLKELAVSFPEVTAPLESGISIPEAHCQAQSTRNALLMLVILFGFTTGCKRLRDHADHALPSPTKCKEAVVNPVSGYASCVDPLGAPVDPPPKRPN
jgi:hypothetical protein